MPRVETKTKNRGGKRTYRCGKCGQDIEPKQTYYTWAFRYGGRRYRHTECGHPRQSELTQSKMGDVYAACEGFEDDLSTADTVEAVGELVEAVGETVQGVVDEYRAADEAFGGMGATEHAERADELEDWAGALNNWMPDDEEDVEAAKADASELVGGCPL